MITRSVNSETDITTQVSVTVTRPANATPFGALDVVGQASTGILTFATEYPKGSTIEIKDSWLRVDLNAVTASMTTFTLHLFNAAPTDILDNAPFNLISADRGKYLGSLGLGTPVDIGDTLFVQVAGINKRITLDSTTSSFYGVLTTTGAYTPASGEVLTVTVGMELV